MLIWIALALGAVFLLMGGMRAFERANVTTIKSFATWVGILGGLTAMVILFLTGRGGIAMTGLMVVGPMLWSRLRAGQTPFLGTGQAGTPPPTGNRSGWMSTEEAMQVLGLKPGATTAEIRQAHLRLMRTAHPDSGGSDWLAARVNQARDVLLGKRK